jgi:YVTN family beta-propeller protein
MRPIYWLVFLSSLASAFGQQAPWGRPDVPVSTHDRVYPADQTSNTVSVIDPSSNNLLGVIRLGDPVPGALSPSTGANCWNSKPPTPPQASSSRVSNRGHGP